jgi:chemotaxis signal transduction protein
MSNAMEKGNFNIVLFSLEEARYASHLDVVIRIIHAVEIISLPKAPAIHSGVIKF